MTGRSHWALVLPDGRVAHSCGASTGLWIPLDFEGTQANAFHLPHAWEETFAAGGFVGDVRLGGAANCRVVTIAPHGNGTHTESVAHVRADGAAVAHAAPHDPLLARMVRIATVRRADTPEAIAGTSAPDDRVVTARSLQEAAVAQQDAFPADVPITAWIVDVPLDDGRGDLRPWSGTNPPYFTVDAMRWLRSEGVDHLVTNLPSVDREDDGGHLAAHFAFFGTTRDAPRTEPACHGRTITEMASLRRLQPGWGALQLHVPPFLSDAAPSRPVFTPLQLPALDRFPS